MKNNIKKYLSICILLAIFFCITACSRKSSGTSPNIVQPISWEKIEFDGVYGYFSKEEGKKAQKIINRHLNQFKDIDSLSLHDEQTMETSFRLMSPIKTIAIKHGRKGDNYSYDVEITRNPLYMKMKGFMGGEDFYEIINDKEKISSGRLGHGASWLSTYLTGEFGFIEISLLKNGSILEENVQIPTDIPGMEEIVNSPRIKGARYDVISSKMKYNKMGDFKRTYSYWFNKETGLLEFFTGKKIDNKKHKNPYYNSGYFEYYSQDGLVYLKRKLGYYWDYLAKEERIISNLKINGIEIK